MYEWTCTVQRLSYMFLLFITLDLNLFFVGESADDSRFSSFLSYEKALIFSFFLKGVFVGCSVLGWLFFSLGT